MGRGETPTGNRYANYWDALDNEIFASTQIRWSTSARPYGWLASPVKQRGAEAAEDVHGGLPKTPMASSRPIT